jgi:hypothetical protein
MKRSILIVLFCLSAGLVAQAQVKIPGTPPPASAAPAALAAPAAPADSIAALEQKVMSKLNSIEEKLDRLERAQSAKDGKLDDMSRVLDEVRRDVERLR